MDIVALGELLIDLTQCGTENGARRFAAFPGGAPANLAAAAARLGARAGFIGKVGADAFGRDLRRALEENGVDASGLYETEKAPTTLAVVSVDASGERDFSFYRSGGADTLLTAEEALDALKSWDEPIRLLHIGSLSLTDEPARGATMAALRFAKAAGIPVSYDPNYRAALWRGEEAAVKRMLEPMPFADILKVSEEELFLLTGARDLRIGSRELGAQGPRLVLVTMGARGAFYRLGIHTGVVPGFAVSVADTNGAGDAFLGALLSRMCLRAEPMKGLSPEELEQAVGFANAAAALACTRPGALPALPTAEEVISVWPQFAPAYAEQR